MDYFLRLVEIPYWYYVIAVAIMLLVGMFCKDWSIGLLAGYMFFFLAVTVLDRQIGRERPPYVLIPFWSLAKPTLKKQIVLNVISFIPIGIFSSFRMGWKAVPFAAFFSVFIELTQLITDRGLCELDDVLHNTLGALIGCFFFIIIRRIYSKTK